MIIQIKHFLKPIWYYLTSALYRLVRNSGFFDPDFYLSQNPDVAATGVDPVFHYITVGFTEFRLPGPLFDRLYYLQQVPDLDESLENPLVHYLHHARELKLKPNLFVDLEYYVLNNPEIARTRLDPICHFLQKGGKRKRDCTPTPYFDPLFYCRKYPDLAIYENDPIGAYSHFIWTGMAEERQPSAFFDSAWYRDRAPANPLNLDPITHYYRFGIQEKKSPSPLFDPLFYAETSQCPDGEDPFAHYLRYESNKDLNLRPCSWFDPSYYRQAYLSVAGSESVSPLKHFLEQGLQRRLYPNRLVADLLEKPVISVVVPVYNVMPADLNNCIRSVLYQSYPHWQLCLADDCSTDRAIRPLLEHWAAADDRIKIVFLPENRGISAATNAAAALAEGSYLAFLDNDDELCPDALFATVRAINSLGGDLLYCDEDLIGADGSRFSVFRKPDFNRELLLCHNYVTHCVVCKRSLFAEVGGCDSARNGAQDLDLFLKLSELAERIVHIPEILYHWRASETSTSINHSQKDYANEAGRKSVAAALSRRSITGTVQDTELKYFYRPQRTLQPDLSVAVLVHWQRPIEAAKSWLPRLIAAAGYTIQQLVVAIDSPEPGETIRESGACAGIETVCFVTADESLAAVYNRAVEYVRAEFVVLADDNLEDIGDGWLAALLEYGQQQEIGMVGGKIDVPDSTPQVTPLPDCSIASPSYYGRFLTCCSVLMNGLHCPQEVRSVGRELCLIRTALLKGVGGFDTHFPTLFFIHDLCFRLRRQGKIHIYTPYCTARLTTPDKKSEHFIQQEKSRFQHKWFDLLSQGDPFYNPGLLEDRQLSRDELQLWLTGPAASSPHTST